MGVHRRLKTDTVDLIVAPQLKAMHFISCDMKKKIQSVLKCSPNFLPKRGGTTENSSNLGRGSLSEFRKSLFFVFVSFRSRWQTKSPKEPFNVSKMKQIALQELKSLNDTDGGQAILLLFFSYTCQCFVDVNAKTEQLNQGVNLQWRDSPGCCS